MTLRIPAQDKALLTTIARLTPEQVGELVPSLAKNGADALPDRLAGIARVLDIRMEEAIPYLAVISAAIRSGIGYALSPEQVAQNVISSLKRDGALDDFDENVALENLSAIFSVPELGFENTVQELTISYQNNLLNSRIITDMRPVFSKGDDLKVDTIIITHNLELTYLENGQSKTEYFALNSKDIEDLTKVLERAKNKEGALRETFKSVTSFAEVNEETV